MKYVPVEILEHPQAQEILDGIKYDIVAEAYRYLFETPIILTKMNLVRRSLQNMALAPEDIPVEKITTMPHILMKLAYMIEK